MRMILSYKHARRRGFTLTELAIVLLIMSGRFDS